MRSLRQIYNPELFQGSLKGRNYFEGWYFKHVSADTADAFAVIPGISLSDDAHSFIQFIEGDTGETSYFRYPLESFISDKRKFSVQIGQSYFSEDEIHLDLANTDKKISGSIKYHDIKRFPKTLLRPGIMGWYSFVPSMECNHGVVSMDHELDGKINTGDKTTIYSGGRGYIEKDWGSSFPESWIWLQCNNFSPGDVSLMVSVAKIPWRGSWFMGFLSFLRTGKTTYIFATYNNSKIVSIKRISSTVTGVTIARGGLNLNLLITKKGSGTLKAPSEGLMNNIIKESLSSEVNFELKSRNSILLSCKGVRAGYEETDKIFSYFS